MFGVEAEYGIYAVIIIVAAGYIGTLVFSVIQNSVYDQCKEIIDNEIEYRKIKSDPNSDLEGNHDIRRAVRRAGLMASRAILAGIDDNPKKYDLTEVGKKPNAIDARVWGAAGDDWILTQIKNLSSTSTYEKQVDALKLTKMKIVSASNLEKDFDKKQGDKDAGDGVEYKQLEEIEAISAILDKPNEKLPIDEKELVDSAIELLQRSEVTVYTRETLEKAFFHNENGWIRAFIFFLAEDLKTNQRLYRIFIAKEHRRASDNLAKNVKRLEDLAKSNHEELKQLISKVNDINLRMVMLTPDEMRGADSDSDGTYKFTRQVDDYLGREAEFETIFRDLVNYRDKDGREPKFSWMGICGDAGTGKSRFALQLLSYDWFTNHIKGFILLGSANKQVARNWPVTAPNLLVIDYAANHNDLYEFMLEFARRAAIEDKNEKGYMAYPVRILLIERQDSDRVFYKLTEEEGSGSEQIKRYRSRERNLILPPLTDAELVKLMRGRMKHTAGKDKSIKEFSDDDLIKRLTHIDQEKRPIFAALLAEGLQEGHLENKWGGKDKEDARRNLILGRLQRERNKSWKRLGVSEGKLKESLVVAAISTFVRGLSINCLDTLRKSQWIEGDRIDDELLKKILDVSNAYNNKHDKYEIMEPDLIGECFVLHMLDHNAGIKDRALGEANAFKWLNDSEQIQFRKWFIETVWKMEPFKSAYFIRWCYQDYPNHVRELDFLLPEPSPENAKARAELFQSLVADRKAKIVEKRLNSGGSPTKRDMEFMFEIGDKIDGTILDAAKKEGNGKTSKLVANIYENISICVAHVFDENFTAGEGAGAYYKERGQEISNKFSEYAEERGAH